MNHTERKLDEMAEKFGISKEELKEIRGGSHLNEITTATENPINPSNIEIECKKTN